MKNRLGLTAIAATLIVFGFSTSCKKDKDPTRAELLLGTWKTTEQGTDDNTNGSWDASEREAIPNDEAAIVKFNSDGTGSSTVTDQGVPVALPFTWNLQNSDADLRVIFSIGSFVDTSVEKVLILNSSDLELKDSRTPSNFTAMKKQ